MSIRLILFFHLVSNYCQVMQLKEMKCTKPVVVFFVFDDMITQEKIQKLLLFFVLGGKVLKLPVNLRTKFRNTHWLEKSLTTLEDKPWKYFCKTSLNARE